MLDNLEMESNKVKVEWYMVMAQFMQDNLEIRYHMELEISSM